MDEDLSLIRKRRLSLGVTQKELSVACGVSQSMIAKIESGRAEASYGVAKKIFMALDEISHESGPKARDIMNKKVLFCKMNDKLSFVIRKMKKEGISQLPVLDGKELVGFISETILVDKMDLLSQELEVSEVMGEAPPVVSENTSYKTIVSLLKEFSFILIKCKKGFCGLITKSDLLFCVN